MSVCRTHPWRSRPRRALTLIEVMVAVAIMLVMAVVAVPAISSILMLEQREVAQELSRTYERLGQEAVLRNLTFRISYHLDENFYEIQVADQDQLIFDEADARVDYETTQVKKLEDMTEEERREWESRNDFKAAEGQFGGKYELPSHTRIYGVYTPQYEEMIRPGMAKEAGRQLGVDLANLGKDEEELKTIVHSYVFANGFTEPTVVIITNVDDDKDGYTLQVEPLSGRVRLSGEIEDWKETFGFIPDLPPQLPD